MNKSIPWIMAGVVVAGGVVWLVYHKSTPPKKATAPPPPKPGGSGVTPVAGGPSSNVATANGVPGSNVYSVAGLTIRSSPKTVSGFWSDLFNNIISTVSDSGTFVGNIVSATVDSNGDQDPSGNIYTWYLINPAPGFGFPGGGSYYVREDYITVK